MKFLINQPDLARAAARAGAVSNGKTVPVLGNLLLQAKGDRLTLTGSDLDMEIQEQAIARVEQSGTITVSASTLSEIARAAPAGAELLFTYNPADDARATLKFGRSRYQLPVLSASDFPERQDLDEAEEISLPAEALLTVLDRVQIAQSTDETRHYLNGIYLHLIAHEARPWLRAVATDGFRLACDQVEVARGVSACGVIIPRSAVQEVRRLLSGLSDDVTLKMGPSGFALITPTSRFVTKVVDGHYPDYVRVIPTKWASETVIDRPLLKEAIKRVGLVAQDKIRSIQLRIEDGTLFMTGRGADTGEACEEMEVGGDAHPLEISISAKHLQAILEQTEAHQMLLRYRAKDEPIRLDPDPATKGVENVLNVLVPLRA